MIYVLIFYHDYFFLQQVYARIHFDKFFIKLPPASSQMSLVDGHIFYLIKRSKVYRLLNINIARRLF